MILKYANQAGQSMTEFVIIVPFLLLIVMGTMQFAFIYNAKTTVNYATFQATRIGAVNNAGNESVERAFIQNMAALYTHSDNLDALRKARDKVRQEVTDGFVCIERLNPTDSAFLDHSLPGGEIPNDNLMFRNPALGVNSGLSIQDANLLKIRITYCFNMIVPLVNRTVAAMGTSSATDDDVYGFIADSTDINHNPAGGFQQMCYDNLRIPIVAQAIVRMQSAAEPDNLYAATCN